MNLRQIEVFRAVMLAGSVTGAAQLLHVSQPGISRMLAHVELQLGVRLFERKKGKLHPTPEAQALYAEVEQVYGGVRRIEDCAQALKGGARLTLRVLASPSTALEVVPQAVSAMARQYPAARIYLETLPAREMVNQLVKHEADVAISTLPIAHALLASRVIGKWRLACVFPKGHALEKLRNPGMRDILKERLIAFSPDTPQGRAISQWCQEHAVEPMSSIEVRAGQTACALVACGAGVAIVDDLTARSYSGDKLGFRPLLKGPSFDLFAVTNPNFAPSALAAAFTGHAAAALRQLRRAPS